MSKQLEHLNLKKEQIEARIQDIKSREKHKKRKEETRAKILTGAMMIKILKQYRLMYSDVIDDIFDNMQNQKDKKFLTEWFDKNVL